MLIHSQYSDRYRSTTRNAMQKKHNIYSEDEEYYLSSLFESLSKSQFENPSISILYKVKHFRCASVKSVFPLCDTHLRITFLL